MTSGLARPAEASDVVLDRLDAFADSTPDLLAHRLLQKRVDRKYALPWRAVVPLLDQLADGFRVLRAAGRPAATYETVYLDTPERRLYDDHRRGRVPRYKVRFRHQLERQLTFLELKKKGHDGQIEKTRRPLPFGTVVLDDETRAFVERYCAVDAGTLEPTLAIGFRRATLLGVQTEERLTLDWDIAFTGEGQSHAWPGVAIVELKQPRTHHDSPAVRALHSLGVRQTGFSKYCLATATVAPVRANYFRANLRLLERLSSTTC